MRCGELGGLDSVESPVEVVVGECCGDDVVGYIDDGAGKDLVVAGIGVD